MCLIMGSPFGPGGRGYGVDLDEERYAIKTNVTRLIKRAARPLPKGMSTISQQLSRESRSKDNVFEIFPAQHCLYNVSRFHNSPTIMYSTLEIGQRQTVYDANPQDLAPPLLTAEIPTRACQGHLTS
jgi:hypothetical protein